MKGCSTMIGVVLGLGLVVVLLVVVVGMFAVSQTNSPSGVGQTATESTVPDMPKRSRSTSTARDNEPSGESEIPDMYLFYATVLHNEGGGRLDPRDAKPFSIGTIPGRFRVLQIGDGWILADHLGEYDIGDYGIMLRNVRAGDLVTGSILSLRAPKRTPV